MNVLVVDRKAGIWERPKRHAWTNTKESLRELVQVPLPRESLSISVEDENEIDLDDSGEESETVNDKEEDALPSRPNQPRCYRNRTFLSWGPDVPHRLQFGGHQDMPYYFQPTVMVSLDANKFYCWIAVKVSRPCCLGTVEASVVCHKWLACGHLMCIQIIMVDCRHWLGPCQ